MLAWRGPVALDGQPLTWAQADHHAEWLAAQDLADAQRQAATAHQRELRAAGNAGSSTANPPWSGRPDDMPVCVPRRATRVPAGTRLASSEVQP